MAKSDDCETCNGTGEYSGYGHRGRCHDCLGTGRYLTLELRQILELVERMMEMRHRYGAN